uniref:ETS domain-containing protein n=1 Tax=Heligmosomoides polygyrus TaxID=6339 RepID=A0A183FMN6_HELPZ
LYPSFKRFPTQRLTYSWSDRHCSLIDQLKIPLVPSTQALAQALVYKFNGPHRRQGYWMNYKNLSRTLRKYNEDDLLLRVNQRRLEQAFICRQRKFCDISPGCSDCSSTAHVIMGQLELGHWEKFSLFIVALCADINNGIRSQVSSMESAYNGLAKCIRSLDARYRFCKRCFFLINLLVPVCFQRVTYVLWKACEHPLCVISSWPSFSYILRAQNHHLYIKEFARRVI